MFLNDDHFANSSAIEKYTKAMMHSNADILTSFFDVYNGNTPMEEEFD